MKHLVLILLLVSAFSQTWVMNDGLCERELGESCMDSTDCQVCQVELTVSQDIQATETDIDISVTNKEPAEIRVRITASVEDIIKKEQETSLGADKTIRFGLTVKRHELNQSLVVQVIDTELGAPWAYEQQTIQGLISSTAGPPIINALLGVLVFFGILAWGVRSTMHTPYEAVPAMPLQEPYPIPPPPKPKKRKKKTIIAVKKKKYYYAGGGNKKS
ncbi:MAG: hypothetical protein GOU99_03615 [Candidatus Altiarchaeota archaeon]|nr:hypothetical protein [Candidatus Altiarchaeota archaeon]